MNLPPLKSIQTSLLETFYLRPGDPLRLAVPDQVALELGNDLPLDVAQFLTVEFLVGRRDPSVGDRTCDVSSLRNLQWNWNFLQRCIFVNLRRFALDIALTRRYVYSKKLN